MHESETERYELCAACGAEVTTADRVYGFGVDELLCFECAVKREGVFDEIHDRWTTAPKVHDLLERSIRDL
jgi:hypothetical protein